jgi:circadian clock protein KaiC
MTRIRTGIAELDAMLRGGFMQGDAVMLAGSAGSGKTTIGLQYLVNGINFGEHGVYLTFEQMPEQIYRDGLSFGWDLRRLEKENKLRIVCTSPKLLLEGSELEDLLGDSIKAVHARRIVVDSVSHFSMYVKEEDLRLEAQRLVMYFKTKGLSSLLLWESQQLVGQSFALSDVGMSFLVDSILILKFIEIDSAIRRGLVILKMRGSDHDKKLREYEITSKGMKVEEALAGYQGLMTGSPTKSSTEKFVELMGKAARGR